MVPEPGDGSCEVSSNPIVGCQPSSGMALGCREGGRSGPHRSCDDVEPRRSWQGARVSWKTKLAALKPDVVARYEEGKTLERRYGKSTVKPWISAVHARSCGLNLVPDYVDVRSGIVVDIGANIGSWTHSLLSVVPTASVLAVEPAGQPLETLRTRYGNDPRVEIAAVAVSDRSGTAEFFLTDHSHNSSLHTPRDMSADYGLGWGVADTIAVPTVTLDELTEGRALSLVKIDVQGAEGQVLAGGPRRYAALEPCC